jgi:hypothetical protein
MTSTAVATKIVGKAIYLELVPNPILSADEKSSACGWYGKNGTKQLIIFPEYLEDSGKTRNSVIMTRIISEHSPRAQWEIHNSRGLPKPLDSVETDSGNASYATLATYSKDEWAELSEIGRQASKKFSLDIELRNQMNGAYYSGEAESRVVVSNQAWVIRDSKALAVEVTNEDMEMLHNDSKTPQAVIRRVNKIRESVASFPTKLV